MAYAAVSKTVEGNSVRVSATNIGGLRQYI